MYLTTITTLFERAPRRRSDLKMMESLMEKMGNPHQDFLSVHVAGTNGKGGVCVKLASALQNAGYRVGLFISPHIDEFEERITVNGVKIPKETVVAYNADLEELLIGTSLDPNFFECTTCFGFRYFKEMEVDIAIIETGLGGSLDATNVISPILSIITSISFDHTEYLGDTLEKIAEQKAGIIKQGIPVVLGPKAKFNSILQRARALSAPVTLAGSEAEFYDLENQSIAKAALSILSNHFNLSEEATQLGLKVRLPCRFEKRGNMIFDVAHNPDGFARLKKALEYYYPGQTFRFVIGISRRKDLKGCLQEIEKKASHIHFVESGRIDGATTQELREVLQSISDCPCSLESSVKNGIENAKAAADKMIVICGSFYIMAEAMRTVPESQILLQEAANQRMDPHRQSLKE